MYKRNKKSQTVRVKGSNSGQGEVRLGGVIGVRTGQKELGESS